MKHNENQKIENLLSRYYKEEANNIETPDTQRCWHEFQQMLEKVDQEEVRSDIFDSVTVTTQLKSFFRFISKYRNLTAVAAAFVLVVMVFSGIPPAQTLRQALTDTLAEMGAESPMLMDAVEEELTLEQKTLPEEPAERDIAPRDKPASDSFGIMQEDEPPLHQPSAPAEEPLPGAQEALPSDEELLPEVAAPAGASEINTFTLTDFYTMLQEYSDLAPDKLFYVETPDTGYSFNLGTITKTDTTIYSVSQAFINESGDRLTIQQTFKAYPETVSTVTEEPGYYYQTQNDTNALHWVQDDSMITITARAMDEDKLRSISEKLEVLD